MNLLINLYEETTVLIFLVIISKPGANFSDIMSPIRVISNYQSVGGDYNEIKITRTLKWKNILN